MVWRELGTSKRFVNGSPFSAVAADAGAAEAGASTCVDAAAAAAATGLVTL